MAAMPEQPQQQRVLIGSLGAGVPRDRSDATTLWLDLGADHPSHAGLLELRVTRDGDRVGAVEVVPGAMHRGVEKLFEVRDYRQILSLADRHDWQAPFFGELLMATAAESLLGIEVPERAAWLRLILAEHTRISAHLGLLSWVAQDTAYAPTLRARREELREQMRRISGNRIHPMIVRIGGLGADTDAAWLAAETELTATIASETAALASDLPGVGIAPVTEEMIDAYGLSGPLARAAGVALDLRTDGPYAELAPLAEPITQSAGDARARFAQLIAEVAQSAELIAAAAQRVPAGPIDVRLPKIIKLPEDEAAIAVEAPLGRAGVHLVSRGDKTPWRLKLRTPSFAHVAAWEQILPGTPIDDLECALASLGHVIGDLDK